MIYDSADDPCPDCGRMKGENGECLCLPDNLNTRAKRAGTIIKLKDGRIGRTYNIKGMINGKLPVYLLIDYPGIYSEKAILLTFDKIEKTLGFID